MHISLVIVIMMVCGVTALVLFLSSLGDIGESWELPASGMLLAVTLCLGAWWMVSLSQSSRVLRQYTLPITKVTLPDGGYKQVFPVDGAVNDVYDQFHLVLPDNAEIKVTEYDPSSYCGISYYGMINRKFEPYMRR